MAITDKQMDAKIIENQVNTFNKACPIGTPVTVTKDLGEQIETVTRSEAWIIGGHSGVVLLKGISGGYLIDRVTPIIQSRT
jgi:hypothetical protein